MTNILANFARVRLTIRRANPLMTTVITAAIVLFTVTLITLGLAHGQARETAQQLQQKAAVLEQENAQLQEKIDDLGTTDSIRRIAAEELGLVDPNTILIDSE